MKDVRTLAADALLAMDGGDVFAKEILEEMRPGVLDHRDRALLTELVYGTVRRRGTIDAILLVTGRTPIDRLDPAVRAALRVGAYPLLFLDRIPAHATVNAAVEYVKGRTNPRLAGFVNGVLRGIARATEGPASGAEDPVRDVPRLSGAALRMRHAFFADPERNLAANLSERFAHPEWLVKRWLTRYSTDVLRSILEAGIGRPNLVLRAPPGGREALVTELRAAGVPARAGEEPDAVTLDDGDATALSVVREGRAFVQDATSQRVVALLDVSPGRRVLDLCAAPGGKSIQILDRLAGQGSLVACDSSAEKVKALADLFAARRARTPGEASASAVLVSESGPLPFPPASFDAVLVDAPCSNTGVLRRRPEVKIRLREKDVAALAAAQRTLLDRAIPLVAPGGRLVYSTCSIEPEENAQVAAAFLTSHLAAHAGWRSEPGFDVLPSHDHDGGFAVALIAPA